MRKKNCAKIAKNLNKNRWIHVKERGATRILFYSISAVVPVFITVSDCCCCQNQRNRVRLPFRRFCLKKVHF